MDKHLFRPHEMSPESESPVKGKFACNILLLYRKQTCWNVLKPEIARTNSERLQPIKTGY